MSGHLVDIDGCVLERGSAGDRFRLAVKRLVLHSGEQVALVGPSGCGKSTALDLLSLILEPTEVLRFALALDGTAVDVGTLWRDGARDRLTALRARGIGYVLQTGGLVPFLSVLENVLLTRRVLGLPCPGGAEGLLEELGVGGLGRRLPHRISIGQRQRVAIARALAHGPALILADEPTASLDPETAEATMALLTATARRHGAALVVVTHDRDLAERAGLSVVACRPAPHGAVIDYEGGAA